MFELNGILYAGSPKEMLKIKDAKITGNMMMLLTFSSGEKRVFDAKILKGDVLNHLRMMMFFAVLKSSMAQSPG